MVKTAEPNLRSRLFYGTLAPYYEKFVLSSRKYKEALTEFVKALYIEGEKRVLEAGCGTGIVSFALTKKDNHVEVVAFDVSTKMLEHAERSLRANRNFDDIVFDRRDRYHVDFYRGNIENLKELNSLDGRLLVLEENSFDYVVVSGALEYVNLENGVRELAKYLKPEGILINIGIRDNFFGKALGVAMGFKPYKRSRIVDAFENAGLVSIRELPINSKKLKKLRTAIKGTKV